LVAKDFEAAPRSLMGMADAGADTSATAPNTAPLKAALSPRMVQLSVIILTHAVPLHLARSRKSMNATALHLALQ
jgi:hypothetical protein